jgi:hypothetical protein
MAELEKLALDPRVSPARVLPRHPQATSMLAVDFFHVAAR